MTPQERQLINDLFDRLSKLETAPRDAEAERAIADGLRRAPNALYPLVQTVLVQDEALKSADARIRQLSGEEPEQGGFLDSMRNMFSGSRSGSVPSVRPGADPRYGGATQQSPFGGGSFLGTAAATAAGVIGGAMLMNSFRSMSGSQNPAAAHDASSASPWSSDPAASERQSSFSGNDDGNFNVSDSGDFGGGDGGGDSA